MSGKSKTLSSQDLVSFMYQVARGMEFLSSRGVCAFKTNCLIANVTPLIFLDYSSWYVKNPQFVNI